MWPFQKKQQNPHPFAPGNGQQMPYPPYAPMPQQGQQQMPPSPPPQDNWFEEQPAFEGQLAVDVYQTDSDIIIKAPVAGVEPEAIDITITDDVITIKGVRKEDDNITQDAYYTQECYYGPFSRSIILPVPVVSEQADATFKNGVLQIIIPKADKVRTKTLKIKAGG